MALTRAGARTFRNSEELRKGEDISPALIGAIQGSRISLVVFSENYADVRHQKGSFGNAFEKHEALNRRTQDEISGWRSALRQAANLSGWEVKTDQYVM
ncbi:disease resistance protein RPV1-like [Rosa chinensis]|uniref:disease resistance protein RPV1-like n=1 Tax=Rosa chinensis TaxID=74649 RepID=UPI000D0973D7|nr:disease resistance protein RPV1-like [Rosa chinensis]